MEDDEAKLWGKDIPLIPEYWLQSQKRHAASVSFLKLEFSRDSRFSIFLFQVLYTSLLVKNKPDHWKKKKQEKENKVQYIIMLHIKSKF